MKSATYKKTANGIEKIDNNINRLAVNSPETALMDVYKDLYNLIWKGSNVVNFIKTSEYKDSLLDVLQDVLMAQLESKEYLDYLDSLKGFINRRFADRAIDSIRKDSRLDIFKTDYTAYVESQDYGVTKQYLNEMLLEIKAILTFSEYQIFRAYHVKGLTMQEIADDNETNKMDVSRMLSNIGNKILGTDKRQGLMLKVCFDERYVAYQSQGKKRQHKRKVMTQKEIIKLSGKAYQIGLDVYKAQEKCKPEKLDPEKCLQYPTKEYFKRFKNGIDIISGNEIDSDIEYLSSLTYEGSILPLPDTPKRSKEYRRKRYLRIYQRSIKSGPNPITPKEMFKGHKSYQFD